MNASPFSLQSLSAVLAQNSQNSDYLVAYSGGLDSHVLLHALSELATLQSMNVTAVHINHGLSPAADSWSRHCQIVCEQLQVPIQVVSVDAQPASGDSPEASARQARYAALAELLQPTQMLLTAHHIDDQAETVFLQLIRGAGLRGIAAMPRLQRFAEGWLLRPLLDYDREALLCYARQHELQWIEDESNSSMAFDRNYLRQHIMPLIYARWPAARQTLARSAAHAAETTAMAETLARQDRVKATAIIDNSLDVSVLLSLTPPRRRNLLRIWIRDQGFAVPSTRIMERLCGELLTAAPDREPLIEWPQAQVRRYRQRLYLLPPMPPAVTITELPWQTDSNTKLPLGELQSRQAVAAGLSGRRCQHQDLTIRFRVGGEFVRPAGRRRTVTLKNLFQEYAIPPWLREFMPLIYADDTLIAVPGICIHEDWQAKAGESGCIPVWRVPSAFAGAISTTESY